MRKKILSSWSIVLIASVVTGCAVTPPGPTIANYGDGSDAAYINSTRGRADAQITEAQAQQYRLQQEIVMREQALEQQKRQQTMDNVNGVLLGISTVVGIVGILSHFH
jgi:hypothetical protein